MSTGRSLLRGAAILTAAGFLSRILGFFFRIFLSHAFGEESVGLYQLIFPVYGLCLSIAVSGIQTAVSRMTAQRKADGRPGEAVRVLKSALFITAAISIAEILFLQKNASDIALAFLGDSRCTDLLLIISYALPFAAVHSCICGYYIGMQDTKIPALSQLAEQGFRIFAVIASYLLIQSSGKEPSIGLAAAGIVAGELAAAVFSVHSLSRTFRPRTYIPVKNSWRYLRELAGFSIPLTANRTILTLLQGIEAVSIPACLKLYGLDSEKAISLYGVYTGMALPCILFPSAITNSLGVLLLPAVSESDIPGKRSSAFPLLKKVVGGCLILGLGCCLFFLISGRLIGNLLFHSLDAGNFILTLSWICPFLYTNTALLSAINGRGKTYCTFLITMCGLIIRISGVFFAVPRFGMQGYLWGLLLSQLVISSLAFPAVLIFLSGKRRGTPG